MTFLAWVDYSNMMFCISKTDVGFICEKYVGGSKVSGAVKVCINTNELTDFLLSFHNAPKEYINELIEKIDFMN